MRETSSRRDDRARAALPDEEVEEQDGREGPRQGADEEGEDGSETEGDCEVRLLSASTVRARRVLTMPSLQDETTDGDEPVDPTAFDDEDALGAERGRDPHAMTQDEEDDFARELAKMMVSSSEQRERKPVALDVGIPLIRRQKAEAQAAEELEAAAQEEQRGMQFTLLTKRGNKQQVRLPPTLSRSLHFCFEHA